MKKFDRRFNREEFAKELAEHITNKPKDLSDKIIKKNAETKAVHYERALKLLDELSDDLKKISESHNDPSVKETAKRGVKLIEKSVAAYGEASLDFNNEWNKDPE